MTGVITMSSYFYPRNLLPLGELRQSQTFDFNFKNIEKQYESYQGINVKFWYGLVILLHLMY